MTHPIKSELRRFVSRNFPTALTAARDFNYKRKFSEESLGRRKAGLLKQATSIDENPRNSHNESAPPMDVAGSRSHAVLEINNTCNIDCLMCKTSLATRKKGKISSDNLKLMLDRYKDDGVETVSLHTIGDPLANPRLPEVFEELRARKMRAGISTNGLLLHRFVDLFLNYRDVCSLIRFSIDGATKPTYEKIRFGGIWETLIENLDTAREKLAPNGVILETNMVVSKDNIAEIGTYICLFRDYVRHPARDMTFNPINSLSPDTRYFNEVNLFPSYTSHNSDCRYMAGNTIFGHIDGEFSICCRDYDGSLRIGDLKKNSANEIRQSEYFAQMREQYYNKDYSKLPQCASCYKVDSRANVLFTAFITYLIMKQPNAEADFYQSYVDEMYAAILSEGDIHSKVSAILGRLD